MPDYTLVNLMELEKRGRRAAQSVEGRFGRTAMGARDIGVSHWRYAPDFRSPIGHSHREQEEAYLVISGSGGGCSTARSSRWGSGTWCAWRRRWCVRSRLGPTGSSSWRSAARSRRAATGSRAR